VRSSRLSGIALLALLLLAPACGEHFEAGLANAPSMERSSVPVRNHDAIANADDSCPRAAGGSDPLRNRASPCNDIFVEAGVSEAARDAATDAPR
jgi:hypothetical protein